MPEYITPGVFVSEPDSESHPIDGDSTGAAGMLGETERGPLAPQLVTSWAEYVHWYGDFLDRSTPPSTPNIYLPYAVRGFFDNGGQRLVVARVTGTASATAQGSLPGTDGDTTVVASGPGEWGNRVVVVVTHRPENPEQFRIQVMYFRDGVPSSDVPDREPDELEEFDDIEAINGMSKLIRISECPSQLLESPWPGIVLAGGTTQAATHAEYLDALGGLDAWDEVALLAIPDEVVLKDLSGALIDTCEKRRDRFAVLSETNDEPDAKQVRPPRDSGFGAFYYPKLRVAAAHTPAGEMLIPPCGHMMGIYARVDRGRGVHHAPADEVVRGVVMDNPLQFVAGKSEQDSLNSRGVNVIRDFRSVGRGLRVWGARTMSSDAEWRYINVRRLCIYLERSIDRGTRWVVFEPNCGRTWNAVRAGVSDFLGLVWRDGSLMGNREDQAYFVKCDRTTMTQDDIDNGRLVCEIGVAPVKPAEFVIIRILQKC